MIRLQCVLNALGKILLIVACSMLIPLIRAISNRDETIFPFLITMALYGVIGGILVGFTSNHYTIRAKEGFLIVTLSWIIVSAIGAMPYYLGDFLPNYVSCYFETMAGFTTTGGTVFEDVEVLPSSLLIWRSLTQWLGGLGVVVLFVAILSQVDTGGLTMLRAELSGPFHEKISSKVKDSAMILWSIYLVLTLVLIVLLLFGGMSLTDAVCHGFSTISTGGFSTYNNSIAAFHSNYIECVITLFMFIGGISFPLIYKTISSRSLKIMIRNDEFKVYFILTLCVSFIIFVDLMLHLGNTVSSTLGTSVFQTVAQLTTTGYAVTDYSVWSPCSYMIMFCLMMVGASYSSTSGSMKIGNYLLVFRSLRAQFFRMLHPRAITDVRINGRVISEKTVMRVLQFASLFYMITFLGAILLSMCGLSFADAFSGSMAAISNNGVAIGSFGPAGNYADVNAMGMLILTALMLIGRLEVFPILVLLSPYTWKK